MIRGLLPVGAGLMIGVPVAFGASRLLRGFLFEVSPLDPAAHAAAVVTVIAAAAGACYVPARRAMRTDPIEVLRSE